MSTESRLPLDPMSDLYEIGLIAATSPELGDAMLRYLLGLAPATETAAEACTGSETRIAA
jgi:hypothetical protein